MCNNMKINHVVELHAVTTECKVIPIKPPFKMPQIDLTTEETLECKVMVYRISLSIFRGLMAF